MKELKNTWHLFLTILSAGLILVSVFSFWAGQHYNRMLFEVWGNIFSEVANGNPKIQQRILSVLKEYKMQLQPHTDKNFLTEYGYVYTDFYAGGNKLILFAAVIFITGCLLFIGTILWIKRSHILQIKEITGYLEKINAGDRGILINTGENEYARLQDELYKTVTTLHQTRDGALKAKENFAENLANIAHQLKTPMTAISLSVQMIKEVSAQIYADRIKGQLSRLTHLEEALLLLSRVDAGTLTLEKKMLDIYTFLTLAADQLQEASIQAGVSIEIEERGEVQLFGDMEWTVEAMMNLIKNCLEHTPSGKRVHCTYQRNPLYTEIMIWDEGNGFAKEDIPHLFERFYRGKNEKGEGIGIGLFLAQEIIKKQNGTIRGLNNEKGGACFEVHFYPSH